MPRSRLVSVLVVVAVLALLLGAWVLRSPDAQDVGVGWSTPGQDPSWLDTWSAWNGTREVGAALVVLGLTAGALAGGVLLGVTRGSGRQPLMVAGAVAVALVVGAFAAFTHPPEAEVSYEGTYQLVRVPADLPRSVEATSLWYTRQTVAALVAVVGLLLAAGSAGAAVGRLRPRPEDDPASDPR